MIPRIDINHCTDCGECVDACPGQVFTKDEEGVRVILPEECIECRACEDVCPVDAVRLVDAG